MSLVDYAKTERQREAIKVWEDCGRNVDHLEIMLAKDFWTDQDMTAVNAAVTSGGAYIA